MTTFAWQRVLRAYSTESVISAVFATGFGGFFTAFFLTAAIVIGIRWSRRQQPQDADLKYLVAVPIAFALLAAPIAGALAHARIAPTSAAHANAVAADKATIAQTYRADRVDLVCDSNLVPREGEELPCKVVLWKLDEIAATAKVVTVVGHGDRAYLVKDGGDPLAPLEA